MTISIILQGIRVKGILAQRNQSTGKERDSYNCTQKQTRLGDTGVVRQHSRDWEVDKCGYEVVVVRKEDIVLLRNLYACNVLFAYVCVRHPSTAQERYIHIFRFTIRKG